ncbi:hypothetical protein TNCV_2720861 [Trichonephila clavipes]|nr:hypothetical protein TNCV_2720861 [Trichonephila clavipes]
MSKGGEEEGLRQRLIEATPGGEDGQSFSDHPPASSNYPFVQHQLIPFPRLAPSPGVNEIWCFGSWICKVGFHYS